MVLRTTCLTQLFRLQTHIWQQDITGPVWLSVRTVMQQLPSRSRTGQQRGSAAGPQARTQPPVPPIPLCCNCCVFLHSACEPAQRALCLLTVCRTWVSTPITAERSCTMRGANASTHAWWHPVHSPLQCKPSKCQTQSLRMSTAATAPKEGERAERESAEAKGTLAACTHAFEVQKPLYWIAKAG